MWFHITVNNHMLCQCKFCYECHVTHATHVRFFSCVCTDVYGKRRFTPTLSTACVTGGHHAWFKRVVADRVRLRVFCQIYLVCENSVTFVAVEQVFNAMLQRLVFFELRFLWVSLVANIASERLLTCVVAWVCDQRAFAREAFPACVTGGHHAWFKRSDTSTLTSLHSFYHVQAWPAC